MSLYEKCVILGYYIKSINMRLSIKRFIAIGLVTATIGASAVTLDEAKAMYLDGDFAGALPAFTEALKKKPKDGALNQWVGVCLMQTGQPDAAIPHLEKAHERGIAEAPRYLAEIALREYRTDDAVEYMDAYRAALQKAKKQMSEEAKVTADAVERMSAAMERVEKIVVIDSVSVSRDDFFRIYRLSAESGSLNSPDILPDDMNAASPTVVYMPENKSSMTWAEPDSLENYRLVSSQLLSDGSWDTPVCIGEDLGEGGDANFPFIMQDGITLYYANDGENSLGGLDIYISRRGDDGYLQPQNIGMPYNSPYDDYMLAIDEVTGVGWWATERNQLEDSVTIYKFIPAELRINCSPDDPDIRSRARLDNYRATWEEGADYSDLLAAIEEIDPEKQIKKDDFRFAMPGGKIYTHWSDFRSDHARSLMEQYLEACRQYDAQKQELAHLRRLYTKGDADADEILRLEQLLERKRRDLRRLANDVVRAER